MAVKSIRENYLFNLANTLMNILFPVATFPYVSRLLNPEGIGQAQFAISFAQTLAVIGALGIPVYGLKEIARVKHSNALLSKVFSELFWIHTISVAVLAAIGLLSAFVIAENNAQLTLMLVALGLVAVSMFNLDWFFGGLEDFGFITKRSLIIKTISLIAIFLLVKRPSDLFLYTTILTFGFVGNYILNGFGLIGKVKLELDLRKLSFKDHLPHLFFILGTIFAASLYTYSDAVILGLITNTFEVGIYAAAGKLAKIGIPLITAFGTVLIPKIAAALGNNAQENGQELLHKSFGFIAYMSVPLSIAIFLLREEMILLFTGTEFLQSADVLAFLAFLPFWIGYGHFFAFQVLIPNNLSNKTTLATLIGLVVFITFNVLLTTSMGAVGIGITTLLTEFIVTVTYLTLSPRNISEKLPFRRIIQALICSSVILPAVALARAISNEILIVLVIASVIAAPLYVLLQGLLFKNLFSRYLYNSLLNLTRK